MKVLLVNPWIYDFAAVNLWAMPLGLLKVAECLSAFGIETAIVDCTGTWRQKGYGAGKYPKVAVDRPDCIRQVPRQFGRYGITINDFKNALTERAPFDAVFMTSLMSYWYPGVQETVKTVKSLFPKVPVVLGGIYATLWHGHASEKSGADFVYKGQIGEEISFVLNTFGFRVRKRREKIACCNLGLYRRLRFWPLLTGTGCPFACSYCASRLLTKDFIRRTPDEIVREISTLESRGTKDFAFYDDALLVDADRHIKVILKWILKEGKLLQFHCPNGLHARFIDEELACLMKDSGFRTLRLSLETVDSGRQDATGGKVNNDDLRRAVKHLRKYGFTKQEIGIYLMYGLPGQGLEEVEEGVRFLKQLGVRIHLTEFSPIPGTPSWDELIKKGIVTNSIDPLLTNNTVFSLLFSGYDRERLERLKLEVKKYNAAS